MGKDNQMKQLQHERDFLLTETRQLQEKLKMMESNIHENKVVIDFLVKKGQEQALKLLCDAFDKVKF